MGILISDITVILLAGGQSDRYMKSANKNKSWENINHTPMIVKSILTASTITKEIIISVANSIQLQNIKNKLKLALPDKLDVTIFYVIDNSDIVPQGPLQGILTALDVVKTKYALIQPVDMPLVETEDLMRLVSGLISFSTHLASYSIQNYWITTLLFAIQVDISRAVLNQLKTITVNRTSVIFRAMPSTILFGCDTKLTQLYNVNTPQDLDVLKECQRIDNFTQTVFNGSINYFSIQRWINAPPDQLERVIDLTRDELMLWGIKKIQLDVLKDIRQIIGRNQYEELGFSQEESEIYSLLDLEK